MSLEIVNAHPKDKNITFVEDTHTYYVDGKTLTSVTTLIHHHFPSFDADKVIDKMMSNQEKFNKGPYKGMTKEEIKEQWERKRVDSANKGTFMHKEIENYINDMPFLVDTPETDYFLNFWKDFVEGQFRPYRTEWIIYSKDGIAGSIDCVLVNDKGEFVLLDWKRSKEIKMRNYFEKGFAPFEKWDNCNYNHYTLQLNIYRHILETEYDAKVIGMYNVVLFPDNSNYQKIEIKRFSMEKYWPILINLETNK
jgi:ATP-dependent exoDNAse (exonuclease V) beta subunit